MNSITDYGAYLQPSRDNHTWFKSAVLLLMIVTAAATLGTFLVVAMTAARVHDALSNANSTFSGIEADFTGMKTDFDAMKLDLDVIANVFKMLMECVEKSGMCKPAAFA
jgi:hypothetical protein